MSRHEDSIGDPAGGGCTNGDAGRGAEPQEQQAPRRATDRDRHPSPVVLPLEPRWGAIEQADSVVEDEQAVAVPAEKGDEVFVPYVQDHGLVTPGEPVGRDVKNPTANTVLAADIRQRGDGYA
jgi:hypothetical protein